MRGLAVNPLVDLRAGEVLVSELGGSLWGLRAWWRTGSWESGA
jgi:hypothetical protein